MKTRTKAIAARFTVGQEVRVVSRTHGEITVTVMGVYQDREGTCYEVSLPGGGIRTIAERFLSVA